MHLLDLNHLKVGEHSTGTVIDVFCAVVSVADVTPQPPDAVLIGNSFVPLQTANTPVALRKH